jgi:single-strand DNA-binding protein
MFSLNRIQIIGYQTQPVTVRQTPGGTSVTDLNLVVPVSFQSGSGEQLQGKSFHTVTVWGQLAEVCGQFVKPGSQLFIAGRLQTDSWEDEQSGEKRSKTKIVASEMIMLDPKSGQISEPEGSTKLTGACNRADIIGNVTRDPEMRTTTSGQKVLSLGVATNDRWKDKNTGEMKEKSEFHNVVVWGELAEEVSRHVHKGNRVFVSGRVQTRSWETQAGAKRYTTEVIAETFSLLGTRSRIAEESVQNDGSIRQSAPSAADAGVNQDIADAFGSDPSPTLAAVPDIQYGSEIKVEDLPF